MIFTALPPKWPDAATALSYPDWVVELLTADLGEAVALTTLAEMNRPAPAAQREDGYVQDEASQWVAALVGAGPGERAADLCAAPGGKATFLAASPPRAGPHPRPPLVLSKQRAAGAPTPPPAVPP